jgi:hypothetical protein
VESEVVYVFRSGGAGPFIGVIDNSRDHLYSDLFNNSIFNIDIDIIIVIPISIHIFLVISLAISFARIINRQSLVIVIGILLLAAFFLIIYYTIAYGNTKFYPIDNFAAFDARRECSCASLAQTSSQSIIYGCGVHNCGITMAMSRV